MRALNLTVLVIIITNILLLILTEPSLVLFNGGMFSKYEEVIIEPFFYGSFFVILSILVLSRYGKNYYSNWIKYIASWYLPLSILIISQIKINSSFILAIDRTAAAVYLMAGLFILTSVFIVYQRHILEK